MTDVLYVLPWQDVIEYSITGDDIAVNLFYVDPDTGVISLKSSIEDDTNTRYLVSTSVTARCLLARFNSLMSY